MNDAERVITQYKAGTRAVYDTLFSGQIQGKVVEVLEPGYGYIAAGTGRGRVRFEVTADRGAYKKGQQLRLSAHDCPPVKQLRRRRGTIDTNYSWVPD